MSEKVLDSLCGGLFGDRFQLARWRAVPGSELYWNLPNERFFELWRRRREQVRVYGFELQCIEGLDDEWIVVFNPEALASYVDFLLWVDEED